MFSSVFWKPSPVRAAFLSARYILLSPSRAQHLVTVSRALSYRPGAAPAGGGAEEIRRVARETGGRHPRGGRRVRRRTAAHGGRKYCHPGARVSLSLSLALLTVPFVCARDMAHAELPLLMTLLHGTHVPSWRARGRTGKVGFRARFSELPLAYFFCSRTRRFSHAEFPSMFDRRNTYRMHMGLGPHRSCRAARASSRRACRG